MKKYMVRLTDDTVGKMTGEAELFEEITISLHDENGAPITAFGQLAEVLEELDGE